MDFEQRTRCVGLPTVLTSFSLSDWNKHHEKQNKSHQGSSEQALRRDWSGKLALQFRSLHVRRKAGVDLAIMLTKS